MSTTGASVEAQVLVQGLSIRAPAPALSLPLPIPVSIPASWLSFGSGGSRSTPDLEASSATASPRLLDNIHAAIPKGQLYAIVGGSGSGKTTLLHALAGRAPSNLRFERPAKDAIQHATPDCAFVPQEPRFLPTLTCQEAVQFTADLKLPHLKAPQRADIVQTTLADLGLHDVAHTRVGCCSGGEQRRLTIACALVTSPEVVVLDECTTGLDASTALQILKLLKRLTTEKGTTVVLSIHAPRSDAVLLFDRLLILTQGQAAWEGEMSLALEWFQSLGFPLPEHTNPLDHLVDITSVDTRDDDVEMSSKERVARLLRAWQQRTTTASPMRLATTTTTTSKSSSDPNLQFNSAVSKWLRSSLILTKRGLLCNARDWPQTLGFAAQFLILSVVIGLAFFDPPQDAGGIQTMKTALFQNIVATYYLSFLIGVYLFCDLFLIYDRESEDQLYGSASFILSLFLSYLPLHFVFPTLYAIIFYFLAGFRQTNLANSLWVYIGANVLQQLGSFGYASIWASFNRNFAQASLYANGFVILFLLSAGYLILPDSIPVYVKWIRWINPYFYAFQWTAKSQFEDRQLSCNDPQCSGEAILTALQISLSSPKWIYAVGLTAYAVFTFVIAAVVLGALGSGGVRHASKQDDSPRKAEKAQVPSAPTVSPVKVTLRNVIVTAKTRQILSIAGCTFSSGRVTGIMGPSGAGKTTALRLLSAHMHPQLSIEGSVTLNDKPLQKAFAAQIAFVPQHDDHLLPALTVRETLVYAARLRQPTLTEQQCEAKAEDVLRILGLKACANTLVGNDAVKGISGGEKRRLSLGNDLVGDPSILIADEPTSGLDAAQSLAVMECLTRIAKGTGCAVIASLHQPRAGIFDQIDDLLLLAKGGAVAYFGPRAKVLKEFESAGLQPPSGWTTADWALDCVTQHRDLLVNHSSSLSLDILFIQHQTEKPVLGPGQGLTNYAERHTSPRHFGTRFKIILQRSLKNLSRQQDIFVARLANAPFLALLFCLFFQRLGNSPGDVQNRIGILQESSALPFIGMIATLSLFPSERATFLHDYLSPGRYSPAVFLASYTVQEVPLQIVAALSYTLLVVFVIIRDYGVGHFFEFFVGIFALLNFGESVGIVFSTWVTSGALSVSLVSVGLTISTQISGIFSVTIPAWLRGIGKAFPFTWSSQVALVNQFSGRTFECTTVEVASGACIATSGDEFLDSIRIQGRNNGRAIGVMLALVVAFRLVALASLYLRAWKLQR